jgi:capsular polysaccharide biosynthesis protein
MDSGKAVKKDYSSLTVNDILASILKYKLIVIIFVIIGIAAGVITQIILTGDDPNIYYYSKATMIVTSKNSDGSYQASGSADNPSASDVTFAQSLVLTVTELAKSNYVLDLVISQIGDTDLTPDLLSDFISCDAVEKTAFIEVSITWPNESESIKIVNALMDVLPKAMTEKLEIGGVTVVDYAGITTREYKLNLQYALICTALGIMIGICAAVILGILNQKIRSEEDITTYLHMNTIAEIPNCANSKNINPFF